MDAQRTFQALIDGYLAAYVARDAEGCAAFYAEDADLRSPFGPPAAGRAAIAATHRAWFAEGETGKEMTVLRAGINGDLGYCLVAFAATVAAHGGAVERAQGTSLNVLERRSDGHWTITLQSLNELVEQVMESDK